MEDTLTKLVETVTNIAPHVWEISVRQVYVRGYVALMDVLFCIIGLMAMYRLYVWGFKRGKESDWNDNPAHILSIIVGVLGIISLPLIAWYNIDVAIGYFANPEFAAIEILLETAGVK